MKAGSQIASFIGNILDSCLEREPLRVCLSPQYTHTRYQPLGRDDHDANDDWWC